MSNIKNWRVTASDNTSAAPAGAPEGWAPSAVNNTIRQQMADHRTQWQEAPWFDWGHVLVQTGTQAFRVSISNTVASTIYTAGRRLKMVDGGVTIAGEVVATSASGSNTIVSVSSSNLSASLSSGSISIFDPGSVTWPVASKMDMYTDTITSSVNSAKLVTPAALKHHVGVAKAWGYVAYSVTGSNYTLINSWNVLSVTSTITGLVNVYFQTSISDSTGPDFKPIFGSGHGPEGSPSPYIFSAPGFNSPSYFTAYLYKPATGSLGDSSFTFVVYGLLESP